MYKVVVSFVLHYSIRVDGPDTPSRITMVEYAVYLFLRLQLYEYIEERG